MDDLSTLSASLAGILNSAGDPETLAPTIGRYFSSSDLSTKKAVCDALLELLNEGSPEEVERRRHTILQESSLTYVPLFLPYVTSIPHSTDLLFLLAEYARPKELVLALNEGVQSIIDRAEGFTVSDDEDEFDADGDGDREVDWVELVAEYELVIKCLSVSIPRLTSTKSTPTLLSINEALSSSLPLIAHQTSTGSARKLLGAYSELVERAWDWVEGSGDRGGEQRALLCNLLFQAITLFGRKVDARLSERWFGTTFPRFKGLRASDEDHADGPDGWKGGAEVLERARATVNTLNLTPTELLQRIIDPTHLTAHASLAALNLLSSRFPDHPEELASFLPSPLPPSILDDSMPILCAALSGSSVDAGITWIWAIAHASSQAKEKGQTGVAMEYDNASMLVELLVPLTAQHPSPLIRLALFKLIGEIVSLQSSAVDKIELLEQLLDPANPFDNVRIQALSLVREQLTIGITSSSSILVPTLLEKLSPILYSLPSAEDPEDNPFELPLEDLLTSPYPVWWTEVLLLTWFLRTTDKQDVLAPAFSQGDVGRWLAEVEKKLGALRAFADASGDLESEAFVLERWADALERAKSVLG